MTHGHPHYLGLVHYELDRVEFSPNGSAVLTSATASRKQAGTRPTNASRIGRPSHRIRNGLRARTAYRHASRSEPVGRTTTAGNAPASTCRSTRVKRAMGSTSFASRSTLPAALPKRLRKTTPPTRSSISGAGLLRYASEVSATTRGRQTLSRSSTPGRPSVTELRRPRPGVPRSSVRRSRKRPHRVPERPRPVRLLARGTKPVGTSMGSVTC